MDKNADIVCVFGGTNDYGHGDVPIGNIDDETPDTFYGALNTLFSYLCEIYSDSYIFVMTPLHRLREDDPKGDGYKEPMLPLSGYVKVIREVAENILFLFWIYTKYLECNLLWQALKKNICPMDYILMMRDIRGWLI